MAVTATATTAATISPPRRKSIGSQAGPGRPGAHHLEGVIAFAAVKAG
jgi:hypothetical protein